MNTITTRVVRTTLLLAFGVACLPLCSRSAADEKSRRWNVTSQTIQFAEVLPWQGKVSGFDDLVTLRLVGFVSTNHVAVVLNCTALEDMIWTWDTNLVVKSGSTTLPVRGACLCKKTEFNPDAVPLFLFGSKGVYWGQISKGVPYCAVVLLAVSEKQAHAVAKRGLPLAIRELLDVPRLEMKFKKEK